MDWRGSVDPPVDPPVDRHWLALPNGDEVVSLNHLVGDASIFDLYFKTGWLDVYRSGGVGTTINYIDSANTGEPVTFEQLEDEANSFAIIRGDLHDP